MPKYTITIADIELNINTEEAPEMVEQLVETVDRRMRSIAAMSPRLSKSEAAIFCAVDYCADKLRCDQAAKATEQQLKALSAELEQLKADYAALSADAEELRRENRVMNDLISKNLGAAAHPAVTAGEQLAIEAPVEQPSEAVPATEVMFDSEHEQPTADTPVEPAPKKRRAPRSATKNKVGDMFDMLTFKDV